MKLLKQFAESTIFSQNDYLLPLGVVCQKVTSLLFLTSYRKIHSNHILDLRWPLLQAIFPELKGVLRRLRLTIHNSPTIAGASATTTATSTRFADSSILASTSTNEPRAAEPVHSTRRYTVNMCPWRSSYLKQAPMLTASATVMVRR